MDMQSKFSERLTELMFDFNNMSNKDLGSAINISDETVRLWKKGERYISLSQLVKLADFFRCSIEYLIGRSDSHEEFTPKSCPLFYENLRFIMKEKGIKRYQIVKNTKIYDSYFTNWKKASDPNILTLITLADYLNCTLDYLVGRE